MPGSTARVALRAGDVVRRRAPAFRAVHRLARSGNLARVATDEEWFAAQGFDVSFDESDGWTWDVGCSPPSRQPSLGRSALWLR